MRRKSTSLFCIKHSLECLSDLIQDRASKTGNVGPMGIGPTGPVEGEDRRIFKESPIIRDSEGCTSEDGPGLGAGDGERRVRECLAVCSR